MPHPMKKFAIGVDIGGTNTAVGLVTPQGKILKKVEFPTSSYSGPSGFVGRLDQEVRSLLNKCSLSKKGCSGVGIGAPGPIDVRRGFIYSFINIKGWDNVPLKALVTKRLGLQTFVDNDVNVMALAEYLYGAGRGSKHLLCLTLGTGIGGGIILDGKLFRGPAFSAAELGHMVFNEEGPPCACGSRGCLETYIGSRYLVGMVKEAIHKGVPTRLSSVPSKELTPKMIYQAAMKKDRLAIQIFTQMGERLGWALAGLCNLLNPQIIIIGGGVSQARDLILNPVRAALKAKAYPIASRSVKVVLAQLGIDAGLVGAAGLVFVSDKKRSTQK